MIINYNEARNDANQLTKNLGREVMVKRVECQCDSIRCFHCGGQGYGFELRFSDCGHSVEVEDHCNQAMSDECLYQDHDLCNLRRCSCAHHSENQFKLEHPALVSLVEARLSQEESEEAA